MLILILLVMQSYQAVNETYSMMDNQQCNNLAPFKFSASNGGTLTVIDWDLQNYQDHIGDNITLTGQGYTDNQLPSYAAVVYINSVSGMHCGVTYEAASQFRWLK
jgi:hypothetical protein